MNTHLTTDLIVDYLHGELAPEDDALAHAHLAACDACRRAYDLESTLVEALRSAAKAEEREMPSLVNAAVWEQIRAARPGFMTRALALLRPAIAVPVAAVLIAGGFFVSPLGHGVANRGATTTIDANYYLEAHAAQSSQMPLSDHSAASTIETSMVETAPPALVRQVDTSYAAAGTLDAVQ
jgi:predicted anti-sigma-YlaC factor YlaD